MLVCWMDEIRSFGLRVVGVSETSRLREGFLLLQHALCLWFPRLVAAGSVRTQDKPHFRMIGLTSDQHIVLRPYVQAHLPTIKACRPTTSILSRLRSSTFIDHSYQP